jgi:hypothetical protein
MRKAVLLGVVLLSVAAFTIRTVTPVEKKALSPDFNTPFAAAAKPTQVEVTNFPAVQAVTGTLNVGNLPAVQPVSGAVSVSNLPLDGNGRLVVSIQNAGSNALVLHSTSATYQGDLGGRTGATQKCQAEFPGTHFVNESEIYNAFGTRGIVWNSSDTFASWSDGSPDQRPCYGWTRLTDPNQGTVLTGRALLPTGLLIGDRNCDQSFPLLCAE